MKKWNVSLAAGVVLACLLAGCGKNDTTQETTAAATTEAVTTEQVATADAQIATGSDLASASDVVEDWMVPIPAEMPLDTIVLFVFLPRWIIFVPVSACW